MRAFTSFATREVDAERREDGFAMRIKSHPPLALRARSLRSAFLRKGEEEREASVQGDVPRAQARSREYPGGADLRHVKRA